MKILVFGATGATGACLINEARNRGHDVTAFVRDASRLASPDTPHIQGDITDSDAVRQALSGQDAVVSALGPRSPLKRDPELVAGVRTIVTAMEESTVRRIVWGWVIQDANWDGLDVSSPCRSS